MNFGGFSRRRALGLSAVRASIEVVERHLECVVDLPKHAVDL